MSQTVKPPALSWEPAGVGPALSMALTLIKGAAHVVVVAHSSPDGDAISSTLAVGHLLTLLQVPHTLVNEDPVPLGLRYLPGADRVVRPPEVAIAPDVVIALDCGEPLRLGPSLPAEWLNLPLIVLDHHDKWAFPAHTVAVRDIEAASTGEIVYRLLVASDVPLDRDMATLLLTSLYFDTGSFRYGCTTSGTMELAAALYRTGVDAWSLTSRIYENQPLARARIQGEALRELRLSECGRLAGFLITSAMQLRAGATAEECDGLVNQARAVAGVEIAWQLHAEAGKLRFAMRSRGNLDVTLIAQALGFKGNAFASNGWFDADADSAVTRIESAFAQVYGDS